MNDPDEALVARARNGDSRAFAYLLERYSSDCLRFALQMLHNRADAEEVVQDAFVRAYRGLGRYHHRGQLRAWLYRILINQCRTRIATAKRRTAMLMRYEEELATTPHVAYVSPIPGDADSNVVTRIHGALTQLPPEQREAFLLKYVEDLTYEEMSEVTGAGVSALKMRAKRGFDRLREILAEAPQIESA